MTTENNDSEPFLISQLKDGDIRAFEIIYHRYKLRLYHFAFGYLNVQTEAEEMVQNVFLNLWEHRSSLDETKSIKSFLFTSTINQVYNFLKHQVIEKQYESLFIKGAPGVDDTTQKEIYFNDLVHHLDKIVKKLPRQQQNIFQLSRWQGLTNDAIAHKLGISIRTVENLLYRSVKFIKNNLPDRLLLFIFIIFKIKFPGL